MLTPFPDTNRCDTFERSFDFSRFPKIQEVTFSFRADRRGGGLPWIPMALSTLRRATSPRLSDIRLDFSSSYDRSVETMIIGMGNDLRRIASEVIRIECEFEGTVTFTVVQDSGFGAVLNTLNVRFRFVGWKRPRGQVDSSPFVSCRSFNTTFIEMGAIFTPTCILRSVILWCWITQPRMPPVGSLGRTFSILDISCICGRHCAIHGKFHPIYPEACSQAFRPRTPRGLAASQTGSTPRLAPDSGRCGSYSLGFAWFIVSLWRVSVAS